MSSSVRSHQRSQSKPAQMISRSSSTTNWTSAGTAEEGRPEIYIRANHKSGYGGYEWFCLKHNDYVLSKRPICKCGAVEDLKSPVFSQPHKFQPQSSVAAVGPLIYVFGGVDFKNYYVDSAEVSYIDTLHPKDGWKVCKNQMPKERSSSYPVTLDDGRVLLVGGFRAGDGPFAQMYDPQNDIWVALENYPNTPPYSLDLAGHVIVEEAGETMILMHESQPPYLYTYNVSTDSWGTRWKDEVKTHYHCGALVNDIYYVIDVVSSAGPKRVVICGCKVSSLHAKCLPVEILVENDGKNWLPLPDCDNWMPWPTLLACGDNKLGMIWYDQCLHDETVTRFVYNWSIFEMTKEDRTDGGVRLAAHPLSQVCYHVYNNPSALDKLVPVYSYGDRPKSNNEKVGKQNKVAPVDSNKVKTRSVRKFNDVKEVESKSGVSMNNMYECLAYDDED